MNDMVGFIGFVELNGTLFIPLLTKSGDTPTAADALPTYRVYGPDGALMPNGTGTFTAGDQTGYYYATHAITAVNTYDIRLNYSIKVAYAISAVARGTMLSFTVT